MQPIGAPKGWKPPFIPVFSCVFVDGESIEWDVRRNGAIALRFLDVHRREYVYIIAGAIGPFMNASTGIWSVCDTFAASAHAMTLQTFMERNSQRPFGLRDHYGWQPKLKFVIAPYCAPSRVVKLLDTAFKQPFVNGRMVLCNGKQLRAAVQRHLLKLCPLPPFETILGVFSKELGGSAAGIPVFLALQLPTLTKAIARRDCILVRGLVVAEHISSKIRLAVIAELIWLARYEPMRVRLQSGTCYEAPPEVQIEATLLVNKLEKQRKQRAIDTAKESARVIPQCFLRTKFENPDRYKLANTLEKANVDIPDELVEQLAQGESDRVPQFRSAQKWARTLTKVFPPTCTGMGETCPFAIRYGTMVTQINFKACAMDLFTRSKPTAHVKDIEDFGAHLATLGNFEFKSPADAIQLGVQLRFNSE